MVCVLFIAIAKHNNGIVCSTGMNFITDWALAGLAIKTIEPVDSYIC
jgi:hypothetical protein